MFYLAPHGFVSLIPRIPLHLSIVANFLPDRVLRASKSYGGLGSRRFQIMDYNPQSLGGALQEDAINFETITKGFLDVIPVRLPNGFKC